MKEHIDVAAVCDYCGEELDAFMLDAEVDVINVRPCGPCLSAPCEEATCPDAPFQRRWHYIKSDPDGARALLLLLKHGKGTPDDFDTMVDRIIESRRRQWQKDRT